MGIGRYRKQRKRNVDISAQATVDVKTEVGKSVSGVSETVNIPPGIARKLGSLAARYGDIKKLTSRIKRK